MTDQQQSSFRFRVPRLRPSIQPPRTTTTRTLTRRLPVRPRPQPPAPPSIPISPAPPPPQEPPAPTPPQEEPPAPIPQQQEQPPAPTPRQQEPPAPTPRQQEPPAPTPRQPEPPAKPEPPAPTPQQQEQPPAPTPRQQEPPAPTPRQQEPPAPTPRQPEPPATTTRQQEPPAPTPRQPEPPATTTRQPEQPAPTPRPQKSPATTPQEPPASPPTPLVEPSPPQREPHVQPSLPRQDEPASMTTPPIQAAPPFSPSQTHDLTKPTSPYTSLKPSSAPDSHLSQPPEGKMPTEIYSNNNQKGTDYAEPNEEQTSMELQSAHSNTKSRIEENQHENQEAISSRNNIPNTPQTKSVISHPDDKINPEPASPESFKLNGPRLPVCEEAPSNQILNEKPAIITLAGDNRGTSMHIGTDKTKREKSIPIYRRYKVNPDENTDTMSDDEEKENDSKANENEENFSYINCNIQGINNSMVFNCSITERSPGVHFGSCDQLENVKKPKRKQYIKSTDMNRVKVNFTPSQKHTIRRRCLRGLFMESSDSDPNDPQKPRHHGCRYIGDQDNTNKDDKMDVV